MSGISDPNTILMTAVLSMDVYDRDQDLSSPEIRGMLDSDLGDATLIEAPTYDVNTLFDAAAWNFNGNVIISYRGTVSSSFGNFYTEALNGYGVGAGKPFGPQATQAIHFYQQIADLSDTSYSYSGIILTGHSLGGGLAGFVGAIYGQLGELFDNMPFESAADNAYRAAAGLTDIYFPPAGFSNTVYVTDVKPYLNQVGGLSGYHVSGEVLTPLRALQTTPSIPLLSDTSGSTDPVDYHSQALLVMALWAKDESKTSWKAASEQFYAALFTSEATNVASALGLTGGPADLLTEIAYSALGMLSSDNLPFGSTAIQSLFSDADIIGSLQTDGDFSGALADTSPSSGSAEGREAYAAIEKVETSLPLLAEQRDIRAAYVQREWGNRLTYLQTQQQLLEAQHELDVQKERRDGTVHAMASLQQQRAQAQAEYRKGLLTDLAKAELSSKEHEEVAKAARKRALRTLRAPVDGTVQQLAVHTLGGIVTPAQQLMVVVPAGTALEIEATLPNKDVGFVHAGQPVEVKVEAFTFTRYGLLHGTVTGLSQDAVSSSDQPQRDGHKEPNANSDEQTGGVAQTAYVAMISIDKASMHTEYGETALEPGMAITAEIKTGRRRVIDFLLSPLARLRQDAFEER